MTENDDTRSEPGVFPIEYGCQFTSEKELLIFRYGNLVKTLKGEKDLKLWEVIKYSDFESNNELLAREAESS